MKKLTIKFLNEQYADFKVEKHGKSGYGVKHIPSGKESVCIIRTLKTANQFIKDTIEIDWYLGNRSNYRLPTE